MSHGNLWTFNMEMCCSMQLSSLAAKLRACQHTGWPAGQTIQPNYPAAPNEDWLFDSMTLYASRGDDGSVKVTGIVYYWSPQDGDSCKSTVIKTFPSLDACLEWLDRGGIPLSECMRKLEEEC